MVTFEQPYQKVSLQNFMITQAFDITKTFAWKRKSSETFNCSVKKSYENRRIEICTTRNYKKIISVSKKLLNGSRRRHETFRLHHIFLLHNVTRREREKNWLQSCFVYIFIPEIIRAINNVPPKLWDNSEIWKNASPLAFSAAFVARHAQYYCHIEQSFS